MIVRLMKTLWSGGKINNHPDTFGSLTEQLAASGHDHPLYSGIMNDSATMVSLHHQYGSTNTCTSAAWWPVTLDLVHVYRVSTCWRHLLCFHIKRAIHEAILLLATVADNKVTSCMISSCVVACCLRIDRKSCQKQCCSVCANFIQECDSHEYYIMTAIVLSTEVSLLLTPTNCFLQPCLSSWNIIIMAKIRFS